MTYIRVRAVVYCFACVCVRVCNGVGDRQISFNKIQNDLRIFASALVFIRANGNVCHELSEWHSVCLCRDYLVRSGVRERARFDDDKYDKSTNLIVFLVLSSTELFDYGTKRTEAKNLRGDPLQPRIGSELSG